MTVLDALLAVAVVALVATGDVDVRFVFWFDN